ncbi:MAG: EAL domain-containing protein, partial [Microthrixaceae bacterium]|nr:EAL domain-containing protein [Microthrixaceae bacterium]
IDALKRIGVRIAIDDFGSGYSSLAYLRQLKADIVKIDRSFVSDLDTPDGHNLVAAIVNMAHAVGCRTVAEGVETADQYRALKAMGCDMAQGFWLARPDVAQNRRPQLDRGAPQPVSR